MGQCVICIWRILAVINGCLRSVFRMQHGSYFRHLHLRRVRQIITCLIPFLHSISNRFYVMSKMQQTPSNKSSVQTCFPLRRFLGGLDRTVSIEFFTRRFCLQQVGPLIRWVRVLATPWAARDNWIDGSPGRTNFAQWSCLIGKPSRRISSVFASMWLTCFATEDTGHERNCSRWFRTSSCVERFVLPPRGSRSGS